ncbi:MAG TPA: thioredoxin family protein [Cytophagaceae bacterium]
MLVHKVHTALERKIKKSISYLEYQQLIKKLLEENKSTSAKQSHELVRYSEQNLKNMYKLDKHLELLPELKAVLSSLTKPYTFIILTEGWCNDSAFVLPVLNKFQEINPDIYIRILLRDENNDLMDQYLTDGGRAIPKVIVYESFKLKELGNWGPRPAECQKLVNQLKYQEELSYDAIMNKINDWYIQDNSRSIQKEFIDLFHQWEKM